MSMKNERLPPPSPAALARTSPGSESACSGSGEPADPDDAHCCRSATCCWSTAVPIAANERDLSSWVSFSDPTASATSTAPDPTAMQARKNAEDADAQAF